MSQAQRLHALDAVRAFALLMGLVLHGAFSFIPGMIPGIWAFVDNSPSTTLSVVVFATHIFRMSLFFFIAGLFARMMWMRKGASGFWIDRGKRILLPLVVGYPLIGALVGIVWLWGATVFFNGNIPPFPGGGAERPFGAIQWTHLWFLYVLIVMYVGFITVRSIVSMLDKNDVIGSSLEKALAWSVRTGAALILLALPLFAALSTNPMWISFFGIPTPDNSFFTNIYALVGFGTAFSVGWLMHRQLALLDVLSRRWALHLTLAVVATAACLYLNGLTPQWMPTVPGMQRTLYTAFYCFAAWSWIFGLTGVAMRFLNNENKVCRYLADSSYWLYLMHLPLVGALQVLVGRLPLHWAIKFPMVMVATLAILLLTYHVLVRNTFIGLWLNGRRYGKPSEEKSQTQTRVGGLSSSV